jgi:hypothetical protein
VTVQLLSDSLLTDVQGAQDMHETYEKYFKCHLGKAVKLTDFSALQAMRTTPRFRQERWPLTLAGSEFTLTIDDQARDKLNRLLQTGLPAVGPTICFDNCPFTPANGYGDFLVRI